MQLVADRFLRLPGGQTVDLASGEEVVLSISSVGSLPDHVSWAERCAERVAGELGALIDYGRIGRALRFEAVVRNPNRLREGYGGPPELHAKAEGLGYRSNRSMRRVAEEPAKYAHQDRSWDGTLHAIVERLDYGDRVSWESVVVRVGAPSITQFARALAREARLRGYIPLGLSTCARWPHLLDRIKGSHVLLVAETPSRDDRPAHRLVMTRALITLGLASPRPHLLVLLTPDTGARSPDITDTTGGFLTRSAPPAPLVAQPLVQSRGPRHPAKPLRSGGPRRPTPLRGERAANTRGPTAGLKACATFPGGETAFRDWWTARESRAPYVVTPVGERGAELVDDRAPLSITDPVRSIDERGPAIRVMAERGMRFASAGRLAPAERLLRESMRAMARRGVPLAAATIGLELARVLMDTGRTGDAVRVYQEARGWFDARSAIGTIEAAIGIGTAWTEEGRLSAAEAALRSAVVAAEQIGAGSVRARALLELARLRLWQSRPREALTVIDAAQTTDPALLTRADRLSARAWLALGDLVRAGRHVTAALEAAEALGDVRELAATHTVALSVQAAIGNISGVKHHAGQGFMGARRAHWRLGALRIRVALLESYNLLQRVPEARAIAARFRQRPLHNVPLLLRVRLQTALAAACPEHPLAKDSRRERERLVRVNGVRALELSSQERPNMDVIQDVIEVMRICHEAEDERMALDRICLTVRERSRALSVGLFAAETEGVPLSFAGSAPRGCPVVAQRAIETGLAIPPAQYGDVVEAAAPFCVLIEGASGSGKELVARGIHRLSSRRSHRFCALNCAALADELIEAELFGYARGAFTGAAVERAGLFEEADGGTLLLDEVGELSPRAQAKLLRTIQEGEVRRIGENFSRRVDARIVAATNRALREDVTAGRFRTDLLYRLDVIRIAAPPLRDRVEDIPLLALRFWTRAVEHTGSRATLDPATLSALARYDWPGNVRELENVMAMLAVNAPRRGRVGPASLPAAIAGAAPSTGGTLEQARQQFERRFVRAALARAGGHRGRTARELGVTRQGLAKLMARLGVAEGCEPVRPAPPGGLSRTSDSR